MKKIWVVLQHRDGKLHRGSLEAVAGAQQLAAQVTGQVEAVLLGSEVAGIANEVASSDVAAVRTVDAPLLSQYTPGAYVAVLAAAMADESPDYVMLPHTYQSVEWGARLAQASGAAWLPEATGFAIEGGSVVWKRPILGGKLQATVRVKGDGPAVISVQAGVFPADSRRLGSAPVSPLGVELAGVAPGREVLGVEQAASGQVDLTKAEIIVAVGRGVGGADKLGPAQELATLLRAEIGASRPVIDNGWLPRERQIGSSGQTVAPKLYLALGISGAIQHLVGMKGATCIAAINKDPGAPIFKVASYGIVGDLHEVVPALIQELRGS